MGKVRVKTALTSHTPSAHSTQVNEPEHLNYGQIAVFQQTSPKQNDKQLDYSFSREFIVLITYMSHG